jgi:di/tricarboxylate transporter
LRALCVGTIAAIIGKAMPIGAPSMLAIARAALTGAASDKPATASADAPNSFANPLIWLIGVALRNSRALLKTGLGARIGHGFIARFARAKLNALGPMSRGEKILLGVFAPLVMIAPCLNRLGLIAWLSKSIATHIGGLGLGWVGACALLLLAYLYAHGLFASTTAHIPAMFAAFHGAEPRRRGALGPRPAPPAAGRRRTRAPPSSSVPASRRTRCRARPGRP